MQLRALGFETELREVMRKPDLCVEVLEDTFGINVLHLTLSLNRLRSVQLNVWNTLTLRVFSRGNIQFIVTVLLLYYRFTKCHRNNLGSRHCSYK